ncbi:hypothetical protein [uncultured Megasphaera sp.]|uniref:hypothetical protein n=1 Tax=uncultured Megasphaera sp. TaxID=165188 RepID=UPI0025FA147C|nr:hypothetical protein [uncultured Megasphaera sp.]
MKKAGTGIHLGMSILAFIMSMCAVYGSAVIPFSRWCRGVGIFGYIKIYKDGLIHVFMFFISKE